MGWIRATPYARKIAKQYHIDLAAVTPTGPDGTIRERDVIRAKEGRQRMREVPVTPLAQRIADSMHIDLSQVKGTGIGGKISKADVLAASGRQEYLLKPGETRESMTGMRKAIAEEMTRAAQIPTVTVTTKVDVTELTAMRLAYNADREIRISVNDLVLAAVAKALAKNRRMLCSYAGDSIIFRNEIHLGMAVSLDDGLIVPVIRNADLLGLAELSLRAHDLARRAREKKITPGECEDGTITVTNMGMFQVEAFTPILHLPNAAILGVCSIYDGVAVKDGAAEVRKLMHICLTFDHRVMDGALAAKFNLSVKEHLEHPESLFH